MFKAQNLVPNGSFESYIACPTAAAFYQVTPWCGLGGGEEAYNVCFSTLYGGGGFGVPDNTSGFQYPRTGSGYGSVILKMIGTGTLTAERREYLHVPLITNLQSGKLYCGTFYVNLNNDAKYTTDRISMALSSNSFACNQAMPSPQSISPLPIVTQVANTLGNFITDTLNWIEVSGSFTATGTEAYLTIGNFYDDANTSHIALSGTRTICYLLIDDVSIEEVFPAKAKNDTIIMQGDSTIIGNNPSEAALFSWQPTTGLTCTNCPNPKASPSVTTTYTVTKTQCKSVTTDVITVSVSAVGLNELANATAFKISPNPIPDVLNIDISTTLDVTKNLTIKITDVLGKSVYTYPPLEGAGGGSYPKSINLSHLETGIYFVSILQGNKSLVTKKVVKQ